MSRIGSLTASTAMRTEPEFDRWLVLATVALCALGLVAMGSASMEYAYEQYGNSFHDIIRHVIYLGMAVGVGALVYSIPTSWFEREGWLLLFIAIAMLLAVLVPGIGREVNGSRRWVHLGPISLQVSEFVKGFVVVYLAGYLIRREAEVRRQWSGFIKPMAVMGLVIALLLAEPDFGAAVVIMGAALTMLFLGGVRLSQFVAILGVCGSSAALMVLTSEYRMRRLTAFMDPWADQYGAGYQLVQSLIAFGRGELFGVGLGNSVQKLFYLPEAHTDFVFAILAEEWGAIGAIIVIGLFALLIARLLLIGRRAELLGKRFAAYFTYGTAVIIALQVFINIGVNTGLLPTKGLTLPFFSYGGSSLLATLAMLAMVLRIDVDMRRAGSGTRRS